MPGTETEEPSSTKETIDTAVKIPTELCAEGFVDITPSKDGGVLKLVKQVGYDTDCPVEDDNISTHYVATFADGIQYESSREQGKPFKFRLGKGVYVPHLWLNYPSPL